MINIRAAKGKKLPPHMQREREVEARRRRQRRLSDDEQEEAVSRRDNPESDSDTEVEVAPVRRRRQTKAEKEIEAQELPDHIRIQNHDALHSIPASAMAGRGFKWDPQPFVIENERLKDKLVESHVQDDSLRRWLLDPTLPLIYGVSGSPDDVQARYFAAYLAQIHAHAVGNNARIVWHSVYGGFKNELLEDYRNVGSIYEPTLLVLTNLPQGATAQKLEKARDLLERFSSIPRIVVAAGEDPLSFLSTKLNVQCNALAYFSSDLMKKRVEVI